VLKAAETMDGLARLCHMARGRGVARELQCEIRFAGSVQLRRAARIDGPPAIGELPAAHIVRQLWQALSIGLSRRAV